MTPYSKGTIMRVRGLFGSLKFWLAAAMILICQPALADKRVALVLGNSAYQNVPPLANPVNDAALMADTLKRAGFDMVDSRQNLSALETRRALREFADKSANADIAVIYYAGHGIEVDGNNYLIPVDARLERDNDVYDEAFSLDRVLVAVEPAKKLRLVILDACRDNPFAQTMKKTVATRAIGRGLAKVEPDAPNTLIAYSAKAGSTAQDGDGKNSPFTVALASHLTTPGLDVRRALGFVRDDVRKATSNRQEPYVYGSLGGDDVPLVPAPALSRRLRPLRRPRLRPIRRPTSAATMSWRCRSATGRRSMPSSPSIPTASMRISPSFSATRYVADEAHAAAVEKAKQAEQERQRLAAAGAQKATQDKAEADAKAAEQARLDAEKAQQAAQQQAADAERKRVDSASARTRHARAGCGQARESRLAQSGADPERHQQVGADRIAPRRLLQRQCRRRLGFGLAAFVVAVQPQRRHEARRQDRQCRYAGCDQAEVDAGLPAGLRARLQGRRRSLQQDRLRRGFVRELRQ